MKEQDVLTGIRDHVRAERADDAALEAVARGEVGSAEVVEIEQRAENDAEAREMLEASRPFGAEALEKMVGAATAQPAKPAQPAEPAQPAKPAEPGMPAQSAPARATGRVLAFTRRAAIVVAPLAVAAAVFLYLGRAAETGGGARLPDYSVAASGEKEMRGQDDAPASVLTVRGSADAPFEILARPMTSAGGAKVIAYVFAIGEGEPNPVDAKIDIAPEGAVRIRGRSRALEGARELRVVLTTPDGAIKRYEDALARARSGKTDAEVRVLVVTIARARN